MCGDEDGSRLSPFPCILPLDKDASLDEAATQKKLQKVQKDLVKESKSLFAESKLTQVLTEPLSGECGTIILSTVSTTDYHETTGVQHALFMCFVALTPGSQRKYPREEML